MNIGKKGFYSTSGFSKRKTISLLPDSSLGSLAARITGTFSGFKTSSSVPNSC